MNTAIVHYSVPPVVGGVEAVIQAHTRLLINAGHPVRLIAGNGDKAALPAGAEFFHIPEMNSLHPKVVQVSHQLESGVVPGEFKPLSASLENSLASVLESQDHVIVHNVFTKHFNLPLTAALVRLLDQNIVKHCIAWCHDFTWTSPHSQSLVHSGYPWDLLRIPRDDVTYVTISQSRQAELAGLFHCSPERIQVIYDGVDPVDIYTLSDVGTALIERLNLIDADLIMLMPVRITQAKNIEYAMHVAASLKTADVRLKLVVTGPPDPHDPADMQYYQGLFDLRRQLNVVSEVRFVYESGPEPAEGFTIGLPVVRELYRVCDLLFMPSHREGFGMPILEAGMLGMPIFSVQIPAAQEIAQSDIVQFSPDDPADNVAELILSWSKSSPSQVLRRRVRQQYTWQAIFKNKILPVLARGEVA